jgi:IclR family KDG regulon transcriptional repressor
MGLPIVQLFSIETHTEQGRMKSGFKRVPAIDKCIDILELFARRKRPLGVSEIAKALAYNKSTVFNIAHTLDDLGILEKTDEGKFRFGTRLYTLGRTAGRTSELIATVHPYLEEINTKTKLSAFLGIRSGLKAMIIDKVDHANEIKIHSEVGMRLPLLAGAAGRVLLAQLRDEEVDAILAGNTLKQFTPNSCVNKKIYKKLVKKARQEGIAVDMEEYIEGVRAFAIPIHTNRANTQIALWAVGFKNQISDEQIPRQSEYLKTLSKEIELKLNLS